MHDPTLRHPSPADTKTSVMKYHSMCPTYQNAFTIFVGEECHFGKLLLSENDDQEEKGQSKSAAYRASKICIRFSRAKIRSSWQSMLGRILQDLIVIRNVIILLFLTAWIWTWVQNIQSHLEENVSFGVNVKEIEIDTYDGAAGTWLELEEKYESRRNQSDHTGESCLVTESEIVSLNDQENIWINSAYGIIVTEPLPRNVIQTATQVLILFLLVEASEQSILFQFLSSSNTNLIRPTNRMEWKAKFVCNKTIEVNVRRTSNDIYRKSIQRKTMMSTSNFEMADCTNSILMPESDRSPAFGANQWAKDIFSITLTCTHGSLAFTPCWSVVHRNADRIVYQWYWRPPLRSQSQWQSYFVLHWIFWNWWSFIENRVETEKDGMKSFCR